MIENFGTIFCEINQQTFAATPEFQKLPNGEQLEFSWEGLVSKTIFPVQIEADFYISVTRQYYVS